jgi:hypothetical protein
VQDGPVDPTLDGELDLLRARLRTVSFPLSTADSLEARALAEAAADQLGDYVIPRLRALDAPLLTVVAGSTGAGKSALVNGLVGRVVSRSGVLRPTTRQPVLVHHPSDEHWFADDRILPGLRRVTGVPESSQPPDGPAALQLVADIRVPAGLALLDAPDIDSVSGANRELAATLMAAADLWLFLTTAARYADAVPWGALRSAAARDAAVALVLNRVPPEAVAEVGGHLRGLLAQEDLADAPLFVIAEAPLSGGLLDQPAVAEVRRWLVDLAADASARGAVARRTLSGALSSLVVDVVRVADAADRQVAAAARLRDVAEASFAASAARVSELGADGSLLRGEVLARWQEYVGAGALTASLETRLGKLRDALNRAFRGESAQPEPVAHALESGIGRVLLDELQSAHERTEAMWRDDPVGRTLAEQANHAVPTADAPEQAEALVRAWQGDILEMVRSEGADRRGAARTLAYTVNGAAVALMVLVFSTTGGITGAEVGIAGGSAVVAQKVLEALFSDDAVRRMATAARERLTVRVDAFFSEHARAFTDLLDGVDLDPTEGAALRAHAAAVLGARDRMAELTVPVREPLPMTAARAPESRMPSSPPPRLTLSRRVRDWWTGGPS